MIVLMFKHVCRKRCRPASLDDRASPGPAPFYNRLNPFPYFLEPAMAIICLALFILAFAGLFLPGMAHEIIAGVLFLALLWHNAASLDFYRSLPHLKYTKTPAGDAAVILLLAFFMVLLYLSGLALLANFHWGIAVLPGLPWLALHLSCAVISTVLILLHMKHEWG